MGLALLFKKAAQTETDPAGVDTKELEQDLKDCVAQMRRNRVLFDLEVEPDLIDQRIYEYQAILSRYRYLQRQARAAGLRAVL